jgi:release factor glutamine methyltransferase
MILSNFLAHSIEKLRKSGIENPQLDARLLICHGLSINRAQLISQSQRLLIDAEVSSLNTLLNRRHAHESVARIIGKREFWGLDFELNSATLEPRPDSETLIEAILKSDAPKDRLLDLGTGTGCLLLSLLHELPFATGLGIDISSSAVEQATRNAITLSLSERAMFQTGDWLANLTTTFDIILSNPPYIPASDIPNLMPEVRVFDPMPALDGGCDGLTPYRFLIPQLANFLNPRGLVAFEIGINQAASVSNLLDACGFLSITSHKDLGGIDRVITATL